MTVITLIADLIGVDLRCYATFVVVVDSGAVTVER